MHWTGRQNQGGRTREQENRENGQLETKKINAGDKEQERENRRGATEKGTSKGKRTGQEGRGTKQKSPSSQSSSETSDERTEERTREDGGEQEQGCYASSSSLECKQIKTEELPALISSAARLQLHHTKSVTAKEAKPEEQKGSLKQVLC